MIKTINAKGKRVLIISDMHIPYCHRDSLKFLAAIKEKYEPQIILNVGDELDKHSLSFHSSDPDLDSAGKELENALRYLHDDDGLYKIFPKMHLLESNHGSMVYRKALAHGIPRHYIKSYAETLETPKWSWYPEIVVETKLGRVYGCHGKSGTYGKLAKEQGCSAFQGHYHGKFEITWHQSSTHQRFNMFVGCLIDPQSLAMAYGKNFTVVPILGCGMLSKEGYPRLIKMNLNSKGRWDGKLP